MPGIVGLLSRKPHHQAKLELLRMVATLRHESFYVTGTWIDESLGVYVGWAVRRNSFSDGMPLWSEDGNVCLVFSGEEFPEPETVRHLKQKAHRVDEGGAGYLVSIYQEDPSFPAGLNGRFHGLLTDRTRGTATLFNDRYGMQRLYYHESKDAFYFSAEVKAILTVRPELRRADLRGLGELVSCGCVMENRTLFEDVHVLPCAAKWVFRKGAIERKGKYFQPEEWEDQGVLELEAHYRQLCEVVSRNLPRYFEGREPIGLSLTGGLDSRVILAWQNPSAGSLPCYTFGGMFRDCRDIVVARQVAQMCGQRHEVITVGDHFLSRFPHYAERAVYLSDGCADVTHSADLYVNERARGIAPVRMTGNYGGEVLRRIRAFKPVEPLSGLYRPELLDSVGQARATYSRILEGHPLSFAVFRQAPWHHVGLLALEETQLSLRTPYLDNDLVRAVFRAPASTSATNELSLRLIADGSAGLRQIATDRGFGGGRGRLSGAVSQFLLELSFKAEYAYDYGMPQSLARIDHLFLPFRLERLFLGRHKFTHFRVWYRGALSRYVRDILLDQRTLSRPYLERKQVEAVVNGHLKGVRNYTTEIHKLLTLEIIHRLFLDAQPSTGFEYSATETVSVS